MLSPSSRQMRAIGRYSRLDVRQDDELFWPNGQELLVVIDASPDSEALTVLCTETGAVFTHNIADIARALFRGDVRLRRYEELSIPSHYE